ncbi:hypothetical protein [Frateuria soli]|uniref:hypothetical protein n=1 Tax=Frateuria soli TaxID=1542730 RepID=UPI001E29209F|nr:hypothetical protein [Frateuria soli]UGB38736.1 hypothetical protein LQ771_02450 [Frateuria soli]
MSKQRRHDEVRQDETRQDASPSRTGRVAADHPADEPLPPGGHGDPRRDRLETIEWADDRTRALDPRHGGLDEEPIEDLLEGGETDASYGKEARQVTPTIDPRNERDDER